MSLKQSQSEGGVDENLSGCKRHFIELSREGAVSLLDLNDHCLLNLVSFLNYDEKDVFALLCTICNEIRWHHSFIRRRTVVCRGGPNKTFLTFAKNMKAKGFEMIFARPNTHLKVKGVENLRKVPLKGVDHNVCFTGVTRLDISSKHDDSEASGKDIGLGTVIRLLSMNPNVKELDMSYLYHGLSQALAGKWTRNLTTFAWNGNYQLHSPDGTSFNIYMPKLLTLFIDECSVGFCPGFANEESEKYLFMKCQNLERLSIKGGTFFNRETHVEGPIPQEMLIKMVKCHPSLRWLCSDLNAENIAMLKQERPHITFVSE